VRLFLNGMSLVMQYKYPKAGVGIHGNQQLFYRGLFNVTGIPLHFLRAMLKLGELAGTSWERSVVEIVVNFIRAFVLIPITSWSLLSQWISCGAGRQTDDWRTNNLGEKNDKGLDTIGEYIDAHSGHRNLLIRSVMALLNAMLTLFLVVYEIDMVHKLPLLLCQLGSAAALYWQWRMDSAAMFLVRAALSFFRVILSVHLAACGRVPGLDTCDETAWDDLRRPLRLLHILAAVRMASNGLSLCLQYANPGRGRTQGYGDEQLLYRGVIRATGVPLYLSRVLAKMALAGTEWERLPLELAVDFMRCLVVVPIQSWSLVHQWRYSGFEQEESTSNPKIDNPKEILADSSAIVATQPQDTAVVLGRDMKGSL